MFKLFFLCAALISLALTQNSEIYPEITSEEYAAFQSKYVGETSADVKAHYNAILRPELFDSNKDRKISRNELREAIIYVIYPKSDSKKVEIPKEVDRHVKSQVDLFINNVRADFLNYKQLSSLLMKITADKFINTEVVKKGQEAKVKKFDESEGEL
jgi:hypothetical protein